MSMKQDYRPTKNGSTRTGGQLPAGDASQSRKASVAVAGSLTNGYGEANEKDGSQYKAAYKANSEKFKPAKGGSVR
jgi:hypothetical protein